MKKLIGRKYETAQLKSIYESDNSEFIAVYGRRRVGKTFLIRSTFHNNFTFQATGIANANYRQQLQNFHIALEHNFSVETPIPNNWITAFNTLRNLIESNQNDQKNILFFDELPWFDTRGSDFISALEHFWNSWASTRDDIKLVVCGSSASWMINNLINNKGGLHNRLTKKIKLQPFTLYECDNYLKEKNAVYDEYQILLLYMVFGGIPYYWDEVDIGKSASQNINDICLSKNGLLRNEYSNLYKSLFKSFQKHEKIISALASKAKGLTRDEIIKISELPNAGSTTRLISELEESGFIRRYVPFGKQKRNSLYQLVDFYTLFYLRFIQKLSPDDCPDWNLYIDNPAFKVWTGYAFEQICLYHKNQIMKGLGITGVQTSISSWKSMTSSLGAQIDLVIDRRDQIINLCEMKFSINEFTIDKNYAENLKNKIQAFKSETKTRKSTFVTFVTTYGVKQNKYSSSLIQNNFKMDILFKA